MRSYFLYTPICLITIIVDPFATASSLANNNDTPGRAGTELDPFVTAAPMVLGAVCKDGVALIAAHTSSAEEPLLYSVHPQSSDDWFLDLPENYAGPFRIRLVDRYGTVFVACGWRADGDYLWEKVKEVAAAEFLQHGPPSMTYYRKYLASQLSLCMARCALSDQMRTLSSACLLVFPIMDAALPSLWLVDLTGAYPVRAICLGGGLDTMSGEPMAKMAQSRLRKTDIDFASITVEEGVNELLRILREQNGNDGCRGTLLQKDTRLEIALLKEQNGIFTRRKIAFLQLNR
ncbi:hypothetical protein FisN_4Lh153 [Fistulifera solaris]|uniref:Uncharacterized protein n=1 Tax=Fistulifera solaris TaxID=1519565 RepID=A0A1Z5JZG4_FISSO|nr:hypothetical protein FisN_4Lh153 [Fistulifera solaris]|eukprot:GAX19272.1 hypothetical protein FisN_4Lh153 [Fistulifera solaris]